ncbi:unnamed protein product, partial [marine sediment metagenome]
MVGFTLTLLTLIYLITNPPHPYLSVNPSNRQSGQKYGYS